jgi:hypothetical protein
MKSFRQARLFREHLKPEEFRELPEVQSLKSVKFVFF